VLLAPRVPAQFSHSTTLTPTPGYLSLHIVSSGAEVDDLFETLHEGMRVRLEYRIRVSVRREGPFRFLGDRLLREFDPAVEAQWDPFRGQYLILPDDGEIHGYSDEAEFYAALFELNDYRIPWDVLRQDVALVIETTTEFTPVVFVPGLTILTLFSSNRSESSGWSRHIVAPRVGSR